MNSSAFDGLLIPNSSALGSIGRLQRRSLGVPWNLPERRLNFVATTSFADPRPANPTSGGDLTVFKGLSRDGSPRLPHALNG